MVFEAFINHESDRARGQAWRRATVVLSLGLHGGLLVGAAGYAAWRVEEVPPPSVFVTFAGGRAVAPPPRPMTEPPRERPASRATKTELPRLSAPAQPQSRLSALEPTAAAPVPQPSLAQKVPASEPDVLPSTPPAPAPEARPVNLPVAVGTGQRLTDVHDPRYRPSLPGALNRAGVVLWGLFRVCVGVDGAVSAVDVLKKAGPEVDGDWLRVIRTWRYRPFAIDGRPTPFCHTIRLEVRGS